MNEMSSSHTLDNLVAQFARPMDFLRELVQNAMDAGTPRVDVWLAYVDGVLEIHVDDAGGGMDEEIIDKQLTRLFSSTKEGDRTKIGKFGIGFSSIFAIQPEAVLLRTGRHGQNWELVFHADRSYDKARTDEPVAGTQITLYKRMPSERVADVVREAREVLSYWCEHALTPITFADHTVTSGSVEESSDPFAAFEAGEERLADAITRPLSIEASVQRSIQRAGIHAVLGAGEPHFGFYNGGLTLVSTASADVLGDWANELAHLRFKVRCDRLEHTLTRDNVLQDEAFHEVLKALADERPALVLDVLQALQDGRGEQERLMDWLALETQARNHAAAPESAVWLRDEHEEGWSLEQLLAQADRYGAVIVDGEADADLLARLRDEGIRRMRRTPALARLIASWPGRARMPLRDARSVFVQPDYVDTTNSRDDVLLGVMQRLIDAAIGSRMAVRLGAFDEGHAAPDLSAAGPRFGALFVRRPSRAASVAMWLGWRHIVVNTVHPFYKAQRLAAAHDPVLAAHALLLGVLGSEGVERQGMLERLAMASLVEVRR